MENPKKISSFREIDIDPIKRTLILCDIDDTLLRWEKNLYHFLAEVSVINQHMPLEVLYYQAQHRYAEYRLSVPPKQTDPAGFIYLLSKINPISKCMFLTARAPSLHTANDFANIGINDKAFDIHYTSNKITKGEYIKKYIDILSYNDVIFIDDQPDYIQSVRIHEPSVRCFQFSYKAPLT